MKIASAPPAWHSMHCSTSGLRAVNSSNVLTGKYKPYNVVFSGSVKSVSVR